MGLNASRLNSDREEMDWSPYEDEDPIHIFYNPQGYTPQIEERIADATNGNMPARGLIYMLKSMLLGWDLVKTVPVDAENPQGEQHDVPFGIEDEDLMTLPVKFLSDAVVAIADEIKASSEEGKASTNT